MTDWSFDQEELFSYGTKSDNLEVSDDFIVKEVTHIYVTQQRIHHFFQKIMKIKAEGKTKIKYFNIVKTIESLVYLQIFRNSYSWCNID
jgi:hypothetical protein